MCSLLCIYLFLFIFQVPYQKMIVSLKEERTLSTSSTPSQIGFLVGGWMDKHTEWGCHSFWSVCLMFAQNVHGTKQSQSYLCETSFAVLSHGTIFPLVIS